MHNDPFITNFNEHMNNLIVIGVVLLVLWLVGFLAFPALGWFIHILLALAIILFLWRVIVGENPIKK
jgi:membrane-bound ClpP family serine protease